MERVGDDDGRSCMCEIHRKLIIINFGEGVIVTESDRCVGDLSLLGKKET